MSNSIKANPFLIIYIENEIVTSYAFALINMKMLFGIRLVLFAFNKTNVIFENRWPDKKYFC